MSRSLSRRSIYNILWVAFAAVVGWFNISSLPQQYRDAITLETMEPTQREAALVALARTGVPPAVFGGYWLVTGLLLFLLYFVLGWFLVRKAQPAGFAAWLAFVLIALTSMFYPPDIPSIFADDNLRRWIATITTFIGVSGFFILPLIFPTGTFVPRWTIIPASLMFADLVVFAITGKEVFSAFPLIGILGTLGVLAMAHGSALYRYVRVSQPEQRKQSRWVLFGLLIGLPSFFIGDAMMRNIDDSPRGAVFVLLFPLFIQIGFNSPFVAVTGSILLHRLFSIDIWFGRTVVWFVMSALVIVSYVGIVVGLGTVLGAGRSLVLSLLVTGLVAVAFQPVRTRVQRLVNRLIYGERDDPYQVISRVGQRLTDTTGLSDIVPTLLQETASSLRLPFLALYINDASGLRFVCAIGEQHQSVQRFPLTWRGMDIGALDVAPRGSGEVFNRADQQLLRDLATQIGLAVHTLNMASEVQKSRERLVTAREEERRRLRRDLHDGLGAQLAALTMQTMVVRSMLHTDINRAEAELEILATELRSSIEVIRELVQGLRPPALDELGLAGALRVRLDRLGRGNDHQSLRISLDAPSPLPPLGAATEAAIYRIVEEATTNAARHAQAHWVNVTILPGDTDIVIEISDNGIGRMPTAPSGVGTQSMRERANELGGSLSIGARVEGEGTLVRAVLPLEIP